MVQINACLNQNITQVRKVGLFIFCMALAVSVSARSEEKDIFDKMVLDPNLKTFTGLIVKAGMVEALKAEGPITLFAPNDAAFSKLPTATLDALKKDRALLRKTLSYHLLNGKLLSKDLKDGNLKTQSGDSLVIKVKVGVTTNVNGQRMVTPDIETSNGVMYVVGTVMTPPAKLPNKLKQ